MQTGRPCFGKIIFRRGVASAKVDDRDFVEGTGGMWGVVDEGTIRGGADRDAGLG